MKKWLTAIGVALAIAASTAPSLARSGGPGPGPMMHPHGIHGPDPRWHHAPPPPPPRFGPGPRYWHRDYYDLWPIGVSLLAISAAKQSNAAPAYDPLSVPPTVVAPSQPVAPINININTGKAEESPQPQRQDYFYCPASNGYYPTIPQCPSGWVKISPQS